MYGYLLQELPIISAAPEDLTGKGLSFLQMHNNDLYILKEINKNVIILKKLKGYPKCYNCKKTFQI